MGSGRDVEREKISWMCLSSVSYYGIYVLFKGLFVSTEKVMVLNYSTKTHHAVCSAMSLFCFKTPIKKFLTNAFLRTVQCFPSLKETGGFVSLFSHVTMAALFDVRQGF